MNYDKFKNMYFITSGTWHNKKIRRCGMISNKIAIHPCQNDKDLYWVTVWP